MSQHVAVWLRDTVPVNTHNLTLAHQGVSSSSVVEHPTRSRRVVGSSLIWDSDFFPSNLNERLRNVRHPMWGLTWSLWTGQDTWYIIHWVLEYPESKMAEHAWRGWVFSEIYSSFLKRFYKDIQILKFFKCINSKACIKRITKTENVKQLAKCI